MKCKDCKWLQYENFESNVGYRCGQKMPIPRFEPKEWDICTFYAPKWYLKLLFWRQK